MAKTTIVNIDPVWPMLIMPEVDNMDEYRLFDTLTLGCGMIYGLAINGDSCKHTGANVVITTGFARPYSQDGRDGDEDVCRFDSNRDGAWFRL
jgi:hypothetical protein